MVKTIVKSITSNEKKMQKLRNIQSNRAKREKAEQMVIGEAASLKIKLSRDEIFNAGYQVFEAI